MKVAEYQGNIFVDMKVVMLSLESPDTGASFDGDEEQWAAYDRLVKLMVPTEERIPRD